MKRFIIQVIIYCLFGTLAHFVYSDEVQINFFLGWIACGIAEGIYYEFIKKRWPYYKFVAYPFASKFINQSDSPSINVYSGNLDENGNPFNLKLFEVVYRQAEKENQS